MKNFFRRNIFLFLILALSFVLRFYHLNLVPPSLNWDEASVSWNANALAKTGTDEFGNDFPVAIRSFDDFKPPFLTYAATISNLVFGQTEWSVRFPSALAGVLATLLIFLLARQLLALSGKQDANLTIPLLSALFFAVSPWSLVFSRIAFEASLALFFFSLAVILMLKFVMSPRYPYLIIATVLFVLAVYTHHSVRLAFPIFYSGMILFYRRIFLNHLKLIAACAGLTVVLVVPLAYSSWRYGSVQARFGQTSIFYTPGLKGQDRAFYDQEMQYYRQDQMGGNFVGQTLHQPLTIYARLYAKNYLSHFNFDFLFLTGDQNERHRVLEAGQLLLLQLPLILFGVYTLVLNRPKYLFPLALWFFVAPVAAALTTETPHASRAFLFMAVYPIISAIGVVQLIKIGKRYWLPLVTVLALLAFANSYYLFHQYFVHGPIDDAASWQFGYKQVVARAKAVEGQYETIYVTKYYDQPYIFFLLYGNYSPTLKNPGDFYDGFGKYRFVNISDLLIKSLKKSDLLVLAPSEKIPNTKTIDTVTFPNGTPAFHLVQPVW